MTRRLHRPSSANAICERFGLIGDIACGHFLGVTMEAEFKILEGLELELMASSTRHNADRLEHLLADEFQECGKLGRIYHKHDLILMLTEAAPAVIAGENFKFTALSNESVWVHLPVALQWYQGQSTFSLD